MEIGATEGNGPATTEYKTLQAIVTNRLRSDILAGRISPGERIRHADLADKLGVSRMPVREALRILHSEGLIETLPHRGATVVNLQIPDIIEIFEIRIMLETRAVELGAPQLTDNDLARLGQICDEMVRADCGHESWLKLNREFHTTINRASGWQRLCALIEGQRNSVEPYLRANLTLPGRREAGNDQHCEILEAARERDGKRLAFLTAQHLHSTAQALCEYLSALRAEAVHSSALSTQK